MSASSSAAKSLQTLLDDFVRRERLPGAVLGVLGPELKCVVASGVLDRRTGARVTPESRFYIASSGKMMTAAAVLQLVDEETIRLDQPIAELIDPPGALEDLPNWEQITVQQLLNHTSGLPDYFDEDFETSALEDRTMLHDIEAALAGVIDAEAEDEPGAAYEYSNTNYALLGHLLEVCDEAKLGDILSQRIFTPAGMTASSVGADPRRPGVASAHTDDHETADANAIAYDSRFGDGPVTTTAGDLCRFLVALLRDEELLESATLARLLKPSKRAREYGLGIELVDSDWGLVQGHSGSVSGFQAEAWYYPDQETAIVFLTNGDYHTDDHDLVTEAADLVFEE